MAKKVLSVALILCVLLGVFAPEAAAAGVHIAYYEKEYGDIIPVDTKGKAVTTEYLYGTRDYLRFTLKSCSAENAVAGIEIYLNEDSEEPLASAAFDLSGSGTVDVAAAIEMSVFPKSGTYYAVSYVAIVKGDNIYVDYYTFREFKIVVDKSTSNIKKQTVVFLLGTTLNGPLLKWYAVKGASNYYVYRKAKESDSWKRIATLGSSARSYTDKSVASKTAKYIYTVKAVKSDGTASKFQPIDHIYIAPTKTVKVAETSDNLIIVSWAKVPGVTGYIVYRKTEGGSWERLGVVKNSSTVTYTDKSGKTDNQKYIYTVKTYKTVYGVNYYGSYISGTAITFVSAPWINAPVVVGNNVKISWKKTSGAAKYTVYRSPIATPTQKAVWTKLATVSGSTLTYTDTTADPEKAYSYTVRSEGASARGSYSSIGMPKLPEPVITSVSETSDNRVVVKWQGIDGVPGYILNRTNPNGYIVSFNPANKTNFTESAEKISGETYTYSVNTYAYADDHKTDYYSTFGTNSKDFKLQFIGAPKLTAAEADGENVKVAWQPVDGAVAYTVYRKSTSSDSWLNVGKVTADGECSFVDASASAAESYIYTVRSEGEKNRGSYFNAGITYTPAQQVIAAE